MVTIKHIEVERLLIDFQNPLKGGNLIDSAGMHISWGYRNKNEFLLKVKVLHKMESLNPDYTFSMEPEITCIYLLYPTNHITIQNIYECITQANQQLQEILDQVFLRSAAEHSLTLQPILEESAKPRMQAVIDDIQEKGLQ